MMDTRVSVGKDPLPYTPFPPLYETQISRGFELKFASDSIKNGYEFTSKNAGGRQKVNYAVFTSSVYHDLDTAAISVYFDPNENFSQEFIVDHLAFSGSPFVFIGRKNRILPFGISTNGKTQAVMLDEGYPYERFYEFCEKFSIDINPEQISAVKNGTASFKTFSEVNAFQLRLFALDVTCKVLANTFAAAVKDLRNQLRNGFEEQKITDYAVKLLGAIILAHKGRLGSNLDNGAASFDLVYEAASTRFPNYFNLELDTASLDALRNAYHTLQQATYSSFTPDMLSELYVRAYPDRGYRKQEGRFDTPLYLTRLILNNLPIETVRPEERLLLDMTCGWGSFLVAGFERLSQLPDMGSIPLYNHILGNDKDEFTAQLARVALLTTSLSDSWQVENQDALHFDQKGRVPTVIVGNPKFFGSRDQGKRAVTQDLETGKFRRMQEADSFLIKAVNILRPGGYLAMVMPKSFSIGQASLLARKTILENCDLMEIWDLPMDIFQDQAAVSPMVLFAQKRENSGKPLDIPVRVRMSQGNSLEKLNSFTNSVIVPSQLGWSNKSKKLSSKKEINTYTIDYTTIFSPNKWGEISYGCKYLADLANIYLGATVGTKRRWKEYPNPRLVPWLSDSKKTLPRPFCINYSGDKILYPNDLEEPRKDSRFPDKDKEYIFYSPKVLLSSASHPSWGRRAKAAIDRRGFYVSGSFWMLTPKTPTISLEVLAAVLNWYVSNAWIVEQHKYPKIQKQTLERIIVPDLSEADCRIIEENVRLIEKAASQSSTNEEAQEVINTILKDAYRLSDKTFEILKSVMEWNSQSINHLEKVYPPILADMIYVSGVVNSVDPLKETITVWFDGINGQFLFPIHERMPGWMLRKGAFFSADVSLREFQDGKWDQVQWWNIRHKEFTYLSEEELVDRISTEFN